MSTTVNPEKIRKMFGSVAAKYDRANSILSFGIHHLWRKKLVRIAGVQEGDRVLDCATGTGDLAFEFLRKVGSSGAVVATDFCEEMLVRAREKMGEEKKNIKFEVADVTSLPYEENSFDISSISFGIRNVCDPLKGLSELARVTTPGGLVIVLEFGQVSFPIFKNIYNLYSKHLLPRIGGWITGETSAYKYLQQSSSQFPCGENFVELMEETESFQDIEAYPLNGGIAYIYIGRKSANF